jgi:hypothetical protein
MSLCQCVYVLYVPSMHATPDFCTERPPSRDPPRMVSPSETPAQCHLSPQYYRTEQNSQREREKEGVKKEECKNPSKSRERRSLTFDFPFCLSYYPHFALSVSGSARHPQLPALSPARPRKGTKRLGKSKKVIGTTNK